MCNQEDKITRVARGIYKARHFEEAVRGGVDSLRWAKRA